MNFGEVYLDSVLYWNTTDDDVLSGAEKLIFQDCMRHPTI